MTNKIYCGSSQLNEIYVNSSKVNRVYKGSTLLFELSKLLSNHISVTSVDAKIYYDSANYKYSYSYTTRANAYAAHHGLAWNEYGTLKSTSYEILSNTTDLVELTGKLFSYDKNKLVIRPNATYTNSNSSYIVDIDLSKMDLTSIPKLYLDSDMISVDIQNFGKYNYLEEDPNRIILDNQEISKYRFSYKNSSYIGYLSLNNSTFSDANSLMEFLNKYFVGKTTVLTNIKFNSDTKIKNSYLFKEGASSDSLHNLRVAYIDNSVISYLETLDSMFYGCSKLKEIYGMDKWDTSHCTSMKFTFGGINQKSLDVSHFDTSNVTDMAGMFSCDYFNTNNRLSIKGLENFNTSNVTNMKGMFYGVFNAEGLDVSHFDTSNVTNMQNMFYGIGDVDLNLKNFNTSNVTNMSFMFGFYGSLNDKPKLKSLDLSSFDTSNVTDMNGMFLSQTNLGNIYSGSKGLWTFDLSSFDCSNVTNISDIFNGYYAGNYNYIYSLSKNTLDWDPNLYPNDVTLFKGLKVSLTLKSLVYLEVRSMQAIINGLATPTSSATLTLPKTEAFSGSSNQTLLGSNWIKKATDKGWTVAFA